MRRYSFVVLLCFMFLLPVSAQSTADNLALTRITEAASTDAQELDLSGLGLTELPSEIGNLDDLLILVLRDNALQSIPADIRNLENLQWLDVSGNQLSYLPAEIGNLQALQVLMADDNQLTSLPNEIGELSQLCELSLRNNELEQLPIALARLDTLINNQNAPCVGRQNAGLHVEGNPLVSPPRFILSQGTDAILEYLSADAVQQDTTQNIVIVVVVIVIVAGTGAFFVWKRRKS